MTEFNYRYHSGSEAHIFVGVQTHPGERPARGAGGLSAREGLPGPRPDRQRTGQGCTSATWLAAMR
ncbi:hypothetical protein QJ974_01750 [Pseudomonas aeruginosa]|nr:hypothetical protein [Pseudomonas aeruginosa]WGX01846.1 hypothetical protein QJ974_01750 [Pseudomonas aeruginosa]